MHELQHKNKLKKFDQMINTMKSKQVSKINQKIKIKAHLEKFEPLTETEMVKNIPKTRDYKQERARLLGDQFDPNIIK